MDNITPSQVEIIDAEGKWNCDKCLFFKEETCECVSFKRLLFSQAIGDDCDNGERPFVLKK